MTLIRITEDDRRRATEARAEIEAEHRVQWAFARWLMAGTTGGPVYVPTLPPETVARLLPLLPEE
ncbi:hypothetical protein [Geodermatophilus sp. URMC 65]